MEVISCTFKSRFGFFKKPDINEGLFLTYNIIPKPSLLGLLGAIIGLDGYGESGKIPAFLTELNHVKTAVKPIDQHKSPHFQGAFQKTVIDYNNSTGTASKEQGGNLVVREQTLLHPAYRCHILIDDEHETDRNLKHHLLSQNAVYIPYFGKNEHRVWWENVAVCEVDPNQKPEEDFQIDSVFKRDEGVKIKDWLKESDSIDFTNINFDDLNKFEFSYFEKIPVSIDIKLKRYNLLDFMFTNINLKQEVPLSNLFYLNNGIDDGWVQVI
jgi:CRISPR-associated protein Cas5h